MPDDLRDQEKSLLEERGAKETEIKAQGIDLFDEVDEEAIAEVLSIWTGIPVYKLTEEETQKLINMESELHKRIIGQEDAIRAVSQSISTHTRGSQGSSSPERILHLPRTDRCRKDRTCQDARRILVSATTTHSSLST